MLSAPTVSEESSADCLESSVVIGREVRIAETAQIGAPYRLLLEGEWDRRNRPTTIGAHCDIGHFCVIGEGVSIGEGSILDCYTRVEGGASLGRRVLVTHRASIGHRAEIDDECIIGGFIADRSKIGKLCRVFGGLIHRQLDPTKPWDASQSMETSPILLDGAFVGWGATVIGDVTIGQGAYICAGATVTRDVPPGCIVMGTNKFYQPNEWSGALSKSDFFEATRSAS